jgi:hypothetical protein
MSFGQGDQGTIKYLNQWDRKCQTGQEAIRNSKVNTLNLALEKVYSYEYYATESRKFVLNFNALWDSIDNMLPRIFGNYLNEYYLHDRDVVAKAIFDTMAIPATSRDKILNNEKYGWSNPDNLAAWFRLANMKPISRLLHPDFEGIRESCSLSNQQLLNLVGEKSVLFKLSTAMNGTIKNKVEANAIGYHDCGDSQCSSDQLISIQMTTAYLTNAPLMGKLSLNKLIHDFNQSYTNPVEYSTFCQNNPDLTCLDTLNSIKTFNKRLFNNFTFMSKVF